MSTNSPNSEQPDENILGLFHCVFPNGLSEMEYLPLLYVLRKDMTIRAAASFVGQLLQKDYLEIYNDALSANNKIHDPNIVKNLIDRLEACGYEAWLDS